ncbi:MAG TPA: Uma2 family endonuclease [Thermomicrobiales bacterium]|jgi:Uma2 family endonuclease
MAAEPRTLLSHEDYFALEREHGQKYEFIAGRVFAMVGGSFAHGQIAINTSTTLDNQLAAKPCIVQGSDFRIAIPRLDMYTYPNVFVVCGEPQFERSNGGLINPIVSIEVLSPSTADYDQGQKFLRYQQIASLREYVLIAQDKPFIQSFSRDERGLWVWSAADGLEASLALPSIGCVLELASVYKKVSFRKVSE